MGPSRTVGDFGAMNSALFAGSLPPTPKRCSPTIGTSFPPETLLRLPNIFGNVTAVETGAENTRIAAGSLSNPAIFERTAERVTVSQLITDFGRTANLVRTAKLKAQAEEANELLPAILELDDAEKYLALNRTILTATTLDEVRQACAEAAAPATRRKKSGPRKGGSSPS